MMPLTDHLKQPLNIERGASNTSPAEPPAAQSLSGLLVTPTKGSIRLQKSGLAAMNTTVATNRPAPDIAARNILRARRLGSLP